MKRTKLYRFFDADRKLLYVGISLSVVQRLQEHLREKQWIPDSGTLSWTTYETREAAESAERAAIKREHPAHNVAHSLVNAKPQPLRYERPGNEADLAGHCVRMVRAQDSYKCVRHYRTCKMTPGGFNACHFEKNIIAWGFCCQRAWRTQVREVGYRITMRYMIELYFDAEANKVSPSVPLDELRAFEVQESCHNHREQVARLI